jgi:hypothetical protein
MAPEPGRFIYIAHFASAILAGFGVKSLLAEGEWLPRASRGLLWATLVFGLSLIVPTIAGHPQTDEWMHFSFLVLLLSTALVWAIRRGRTGAVIAFAMVAITLFDLHGFNWTILSRTEARSRGRDDLGTLLNARNVAAFLKSRPGLYRTHFDGEWRPNIGDMYGVQTLEGKTATMLLDFEGFWKIPKAADLMNIRYFIVGTKDNTATAQPIYQDADWKVIENSAATPRGWLVHDFSVEPSRDRVFERLKDPTFDPRQTAILMESPSSNIAPVTANASRETVTFNTYEPGRIELQVHAESNALLVLSEVNFPGWEVRLKGQRVETQRADWMIRSLAVPAGDSTVTMRYKPRSFIAGAGLSAATFGGALILALFTLI